MDVSMFQRKERMMVEGTLEYIGSQRYYLPSKSSTVRIWCCTAIVADVAKT